MLHNVLVMAMKGAILCILLQKCLVNGHSIKLFEIQQEDRDTKCTAGFIEDSDTVRLKSQVNFSGDQHTTFVNFYVKSANDKKFYLLNSFNVYKDCLENETLTCIEVSQNVVNITVQLKAKKELSQALIYGKLLDSTHLESKSKTQDFPMIYGSSDINGTLVVNGHVIKIIDDQCFTELSGNNFNIEYRCESKVSPCVIDLSFDDQEKHVSGIGIAQCNKTIKSKARVSFLIRHAPCRFGKNAKFKTCIIQGSDGSDQTTRSFSKTLIIIIIPWIMLVVLIPLTLCIFYRYRKEKRIMKQEHEFESAIMKKDIKLLQSEYKTTPQKKEDTILSILDARFGGDTTASSSRVSLYVSATDINVGSQ